VHVVLVSTYSPLAVGGIGQFVHDLSIALHRRGHEVTAVYRYERPEFRISGELRNAAHLVELRPRDVGGLRTFSVNRQTSSWVRNNRRNIDALHVLNPMPMAAAAIRAGHKYGVPSVATIYAKYPRSPKPLLRWANARAQEIVLREADVLAYESVNTMREFAPVKGRVILNGIDTEYFCPRPEVRERMRQTLGVPEDEFVLLFLGRMDRLKGIYLFLEALGHLRRRAGRFSCLLVGSLEVDDIPQWIGKLGLKDTVKLIGPVGKLDVLDYYCAADLFVLPSYLEGISSALIEAMACGLPVVATNVGGNPEVIRDGIDGIVIEPGNRHALSEALARFVENPSLARSFGAAARARIQERFSLDVMTEQYLKAYGEARAKSQMTSPPLSGWL